jgi:hypothetical protein
MTASTYIFGALCPAKGKAADLVLFFCNTEAMTLHLKGIAAHVARVAHAELPLEQAGWHPMPRLGVPLTVLRDNSLSNRVFGCYDDIAGPCCDAFERAHRSTVETHVYRPTHIGSCGIINGSWYDFDNLRFSSEKVSGLSAYQQSPIQKEITSFGTGVAAA